MANQDKIAEFEKIVIKYQTMVFRTAIGFVHQKEDAEDLAQEVFLNAYKSWNNFRGDSEISTWLYRITINLSLNFIEKSKRKNFLQLTGDALIYLFNRDSGEKNPQQQIEISEQEKIIKATIDSLPEKQRIAFVLSRYDDLPQKEIASIMNISEGAVEQLLQRAKANLQRKLEQAIGKINE